MNYDITPIIHSVITLLAALVSVFVIPFIKGKVGAQNMSELLAWIEIAVKAAEQLYTSADGEMKKQYVLTFLANKGFDINGEEIENAIEAAVLDIHNKLYGTEKDLGKSNSKE